MAVDPLSLGEQTLSQPPAVNTYLAPGLAASEWVDFDSYISKLSDGPHVDEDPELYTTEAIHAMYRHLWYLAACKSLQGEAPVPQPTSTATTGPSLKAEAGEPDPDISQAVRTQHCQSESGTAAAAAGQLVPGAREDQAATVPPPTTQPNLAVPPETAAGELSPSKPAAAQHLPDSLAEAGQAASMPFLHMWRYLQKSVVTVAEAGTALRSAALLSSKRCGGL